MKHGLIAIVGFLFSPLGAVVVVSEIVNILSYPLQSEHYTSGLVNKNAGNWLNKASSTEN
jgi:hypothetical protein